MNAFMQNMWARLCPRNTEHKTRAAPLVHKSSPSDEKLSSAVYLTQTSIKIYHIKCQDPKLSVADVASTSELSTVSTLVLLVAGNGNIQCGMVLVAFCLCQVS